MRPDHRDIDHAVTLSSELREEFKNNGVVVIPGFYDPKRDLEPIQYSIHCLLSILLKKYKVKFYQEPFSANTFDSGYQELIATNRQIGSEVYDAVKQIPAFVRLVADQRNEDLFRLIRPNSVPGIASAGYGIRINNPHEEQYRADWHQDYTSQLRSMDGLVFWSPLVHVTPELGPVQFCLGSHKHGPIPVFTKNHGRLNKPEAYTLVLENENQLDTLYCKSAPLTRPGDLVLIDYLTVHQSGYNRSTRSLWTMQMRCFNFAEPSGIKIGWQGSFQGSNKLSELCPDLILDKE